MRSVAIMRRSPGGRERHLPTNRAFRRRPRTHGVDRTRRGSPGRNRLRSGRNAFRTGLDRNRGRDIRRGFTSVGPHRDDLVVRADVEANGPERDLRAFGSGGQKRTAAVALRLVEADSLQDASGREPVYLLDDVFAELDRERAERVFRLLEDGRTGQVFLTAPKPSDMPFRDGGLSRWRIRDGALVGR